MAEPIVDALPALPLAQQRAALWADPRQRVYAALVTPRVPGLRQRLAGADVDDWDGLWTGELDAEERAAAPLLVTLRPQSSFTDWLLGGIAGEVEGWGTLAVSAMPFLAMRAHGRALCRAQLPNGQSIRLDWMDPETLDLLLGSASGDQLQRVFSGVDRFVSATADRWTRRSVNIGRLVAESSGVLA